MFIFTSKPYSERYRTAYNLMAVKGTYVIFLSILLQVKMKVHIHVREFLDGD